MMQLEKMLSGGNLRSIGQSNSVVAAIKTQNDFDKLFKFLFQSDRLIVMRAADAIEKITAGKPQYLFKHKEKILELCKVAKDKEFKWHLALLLPRLQLNEKDLSKIWDMLTNWAKDKTMSRIVRVNSIQDLFELLKQQSDLIGDFRLTLLRVEQENIPSINARIKRIKKTFSQIKE